MPEDTLLGGKNVTNLEDKSIFGGVRFNKWNSVFI